MPIDPRATAIARRIRAARLTAGITQTNAATIAGVNMQTWRNWEHGERTPRPWNLLAAADALGVPVASLLRDELVLAEVRVSAETLERCKREGRPAIDEAARRIASGLGDLLEAEVSRPAVDVSAGARPKPRRSRAEGIAEANRARAAARARDRIAA